MQINEIAARKTFYRDAFEAGKITGEEYQAFIEAINQIVVNRDDLKQDAKEQHHMSRNSIKAIDIYVLVLNCNDRIKSLTDTYPEEIPYWTKEREALRERLRKVMAKVTLEEFLRGKWGGRGREYRMQKWNDMQAWCAPTEPSPAARPAGGGDSSSG